MGCSRGEVHHCSSHLVSPSLVRRNGRTVVVVVIELDEVSCVVLLSSRKKENSVNGYKAS